MPQIKADDPSLKALEGIHLWHAGLSSCSQRVRLALREKQLSYVSHEINLQAGENASAAYQQIHPKGLVPAMVIDGDVFIESIDIIAELDRRFPQPPLLPEDAEALHIAQNLMQRADQAQAALKLLTFEFLFSAAPPPPKSQQEAFQRNHRNDALKQFHADVAKGFERPRIEAAVKTSRDDFDYLDAQLRDDRAFLAGDRFSLADVAWMPNLHRYHLIGWPFTNTPYLDAWFKRVQTRQSYTSALIAWQPSVIAEKVLPNIRQRQNEGRGVETYGLTA